jgi:hypothetical protein
MGNKEKDVDISEFMNSKDQYVTSLLKGYVKDHKDLTLTKD